MDVEHQQRAGDVLEMGESSKRSVPLPNVKRRKLRKGTESCSECRRRKTRCSFSAAHHPICDGCKHRGTRCFSQRFSDEFAATQPRTLGDRLKLLESLMERVLQELPEVKNQMHFDPASLPQNSSQSIQSHVQERFNTNQTTRHLIQASAILSCPSNENGKSYNALYAAWPPEHELDTILNSPYGASWPSYGILYKPYCRVLPEDIPTPKDVLQPPQSGAHPTLIARKLLLLASFLQGSLRCPGRQLHSNSEGIMVRAINAANTTVTNNDALVDSIEGIECLMMETNIHNSCGNLRQAWLTLRRALAMAQSLGLHQRPVPTFVRTLEPETGVILDVEYLWFRLSHFDRYLSLVLGLPQVSLDDRIASRDSLQRCTPEERFERIECVAAGHILRRSGAKSNDFKLSRGIKAMLKASAACMPSQWWLKPTLSTLPMDDSRGTEAMTNMSRLMNHFMHYSLVIQANLPCLLDVFIEGTLNDETLTATAASRELLIRYIYLHDSDDNIQSYCGGVDSLAFVGAATLCLAHILAHRLMGRGDTTGGTTSLDLLKQQRLADRSLSEKVVTILETALQDVTDKITLKRASVLRALMSMEVQAARGQRYNLSLCRGTGSQQQPVIENRVFVEILYACTIKVEREETVP